MSRPTITQVREQYIGLRVSWNRGGGSPHFPKQTITGIVSEVWRRTYSKGTVIDYCTVIRDDGFSERGVSIAALTILPERGLMATERPSQPENRATQPTLFSKRQLERSRKDEEDETS